MPSEPRNVFILTADSLRADVCPGRAADIATLIRGVNFTNAVATGSATAHSIPTLACGQYKHEVGPTLDESQGDTLAEHLSTFGFDPFLWSDNEILGPDRGFCRGFANTDSGQTGTSWEQRFRSIVADVNSEAFFKFAQWSYFRILKPIQDAATSNSEYYLPADHWHDRVLSHFDGDDRTGQFHWIHYMDTHHPFEPPTEYLDQYDFAGSASRRRLSELSSEAIISNVGENVSAADIQDIWKAYRACCDYWYDTIEQFVRTMLEAGYYDPTRDVMVVSSDHGEGFDVEKHGMVGHTPTPAFWEDLMRVPLVVALPEWGPGQCTDQTSLIDVYPTILSGLDLPVPESASGRSAEDPSDLEREYTTFSAKGPDKYFFGVRRNDGWKLFGDRIRTKEGVSFTMDEREENYERAVLTTLDVPEYGETTEYERPLSERGTPNGDLARVWDDLSATLDGFAGGLTSASTEELSDDLKDQLRDLGYVDDIPE